MYKINFHLFFLLLFASINAFAINQKDVALNQSEQLNVSSKVEKFYIDETGNLPAEEIFKKDFTNVKNELWHSPNSVDKYYYQNLNGRNVNAKSQIHS